MASIFNPKLEDIENLKTWDDVVKHVGMKPEPGKALLEALGIEDDDKFDTLALASQQQIDSDLASWTWTVGGVTHRPKSKHFGQAGLVARYARLLSGAEKMPETDTQATPYASTTYHHSIAG